MATKYDLEILVRTKKQGTGVKDAEQEIEGFGKRLNSTLGVIEASTAAAIAAGVTFKQAFELSREGASLIQLETSFNRFNDAVIGTPDLLERFNDAADGTIAKSELMSGLLTLTAGASDDYSRALAGAYPQLIEIARASSALNPALGDTSFMLESLTTAAKRQSVPIADNLGLIIKMETAVREVHPALQTLATDYEDLSQQQKFLNELLFQGDTLITQTGGSVDSMTDSYDRLTVKVNEGIDSLKRWLADGLTPILEGAEMMQKEYEEALGNINEMVSRGIISQERGTALYTGLTLLDPGQQAAYRMFMRTLEEKRLQDDLNRQTIERHNEALLRQGQLLMMSEAITVDHTNAVISDTYSVNDWNQAVQAQQFQAANAAKAMEERAAALEAEAEALAASKAQLANFFVQAQEADGAALDLNETLYDMLVAGGAPAEGLALAGVALGEFDQEAANAYLKTALIKQGLDEIATAALEDGQITAQEMINIRGEIDNLVESVNSIPDVAYTDIIVRTEEANQKVKDFKKALDEATAARSVAINIAGNALGAINDMLGGSGALPTARSVGAQ